MIAKGLKPRDIVVRDSIRNAVIVAMAIGGSTNVTLHAPEIARAAGYADFWKDVMTPAEFNHLSQHVVPVLTDARPYGKYSMVDIDEVGGVQVIVRELLEAGLLNGDVMTCTGETLAAQVERLGAKAADGKVIYPVAKPYKPTGGLRVLGGNLSPDFSAILKLAGVEGGLENNMFRGKARVFEGEQALLDALDQTPEQLPEQRHDHRALRGAERRAGHAGDARPDLAHHHAVPRARHRRGADDRRAVLRRIGRSRHRPCRSGSRARRTDRACSGRRRDRRRPEHERAQLHARSPIRPSLKQRKADWDKVVAANGGIHPNCGVADTRLLHRARLTAVPATRGGGPASQPRGLGARAARRPKRSGFVPSNKHRPETEKAF